MAGGKYNGRTDGVSMPQKKFYIRKKTPTHPGLVEPSREDFTDMNSSVQLYNLRAWALSLRSSFIRFFASQIGDDALKNVTHQPFLTFRKSSGGIIWHWIY